MKAILTYHSIDPSGSPISVPADAFDGHRRWLESGRVQVLPLDEIARHPADGPDAVSVTFDDGFLNARTPIESLLNAGLPVTVFAVTGHVGRTNTWGGTAQRGIPTLALLDWPDLESLLQRGAAIEAHTRSHPYLDRLSPDAIDEELGACAEALRTRLGVASRHVAYPYGAVNTEVIGRASRMFASGYTTEFRPLRGREVPLAMPRLDMYYFRAPGALERWGGRAFTWRIAAIRARRMIRASVSSR